MVQLSELLPTRPETMLSAISKCSSDLFPPHSSSIFKICMIDMVLVRQCCSTGLKLRKIYKILKTSNKIKRQTEF